MQRTPLFLLSAAVLSLLALVGRPAALAPRAPQLVPTVGAGQVDAHGQGLAVNVASSHGALLAAGGELFAQVTVTAAQQAAAAHQPVAMVIVLDRSGSMAGGKIAQARTAAHRLISQMDEGDELAVVAFDSEIMSSGAFRLDDTGRQHLSSFVSSLDVGGATNLSGGLQAGRELLSRMAGAPRLVLISDGQPTAGITDSHQLVQLVDAVHEAGITVTALGVGYDFDARLMQGLAERGGGLSGSLDDAARLGEVLTMELNQARAVAARNVTLVLAPGPGVTIEEVPGRIAQQLGTTTALQLRDFRPGDQAVTWVRLRTAAGASGQATLLNASVQWTAADGSRLASAAQVNLPVAERQADFDASRDEALFASGVKALGSTKMVAAADALARGDNEGAVSLLQAARSIFGMSADALSGETADTERMEADIRHVKGDSARAASHMLEKKAMVNFARENDGY